MIDKIQFNPVWEVFIGMRNPLMTSWELVENNATELDFTVVIHGKIDAIPQEQVFPMTLEIYGDDSTLLGTKDVNIRVPAVPNAN